MRRFLPVLLTIAFLLTMVSCDTGSLPLLPGMPETVKEAEKVLELDTTYMYDIIPLRLPEELGSNLRLKAYEEQAEDGNIRVEYFSSDETAIYLYHDLQTEVGSGEYVSVFDWDGNYIESVFIPRNIPMPEQKYSGISAYTFTRYTQKGTFDITMNKQTFHLNEKSVLLIPPYQFIKGTPEQNNEMHECILFTLEFQCDYFNFFQIDNYLLLNEAESLEALLTELYNECKTVNSNNCYNDAWLLLIIRALKRLSIGHSEQLQLAEKVRTYILHHVMQPITVTEISEILKYNKDYLCRVFKREYGCSIKEFINKEKINLSKRLLQTSDLPVATISQMLGWDDVNLFFKYFKYHEKTTPTQYRMSTVH